MQWQKKISLLIMIIALNPGFLEKKQMGYGDIKPYIEKDAFKIWIIKVGFHFSTAVHIGMI